MALLFYVIKIKQVLFSKLACCLSSKFILHEMPRKKIALFQKFMLEKHCAVVKSYWWHIKKIIYWENYYLAQPEILCQFFRKK